MLQLTTSDEAQKMGKIQALSDAILRAEAAYEKQPSYENAQNVQHLRRQRSELQGTMPLRVVH